LGALYASGPMTRSHATEAAGLARSAAGKAVEDLERLGMLRTHTPLAPGTPGRPSPKLVLCDSGAVVISVVLGREGIELAVVDLGRRILQRRSETFDTAALAPEDTLKRMADAITRLAREISVPCVGIGISVPGLYSQQTGVAQALLPIGWRDVPMGAILARLLPLDTPQVIAHDATLGALAELHTGVGRGAQRLLFLTGQRIGVGSALIVADEHAGRSDHSLQAGHLIVNPAGPRCTCGAKGCLELFVDGRALARALGLPDAHPTADLHRSLLNPSSAAKKRLDGVMDHLEVGLISLVNTLAPDRVILSGLLSDLAALYPERLSETLNLSVIAQISPVTLARSTMKNHRLLGASELAFEPLLRDPEGLLGAMQLSKTSDKVNANVGCT
jgi:predicted NBD/HSP70 family sugar kinase